MDELLAQFIVEARELTQQAADDLLALERNPADRTHLESAFRAFHTLKGSAGLFPFAPLQAALHAAEDVLAAATTAGEMEPALVDPLLAILEWTDRCVGNVASTGLLPANADAESADLMRPLGGSANATAVSVPAIAEIPAWARALFQIHAEALVAVRYTPDPECFFNGDDPLALVSTVPTLTSLSILPRQDWPAPENLDPFRCNLVVELTSSASRPEIEQIFRLIPDQVTLVSRPVEGKALPVRGPAPAAAAERHEPVSVRVDAARIDALLDIVGELYTARDGLLRLSQSTRGGGVDPAIARQAAGSLQQFDRLLAQLRKGVMDVRMVPLAQTFRRLPRVVREVAQQSGKKVNVEISGDDIEADRTIVEGLFEPLLHMIRNAVDHGIEPADARIAAAKSATGTVTVAARSVGDQISITVADDGRGIDLAKVKAAALQRGLLDESRSEQLQEAEIIELLFAPGFSTAETVSELSGRGVGMDAVRNAVQTLGGQVSISSRYGHGTSVDLNIPVSFSMSRLLTVATDGEWYGIPLSAISETIRLPAQSVIPVRSGLAFSLRERTIPFLALSDLLGGRKKQEDSHLILVVSTPEGPLGLSVDAIGERTEIMVRPLAGLLQGAHGIAGTTVLGDGRILMILDVESLAR